MKVKLTIEKRNLFKRQTRSAEVELPDPEPNWTMSPDQSCVHQDARMKQAIRTMMDELNK